jgi:hypothetical protein
MTAEQETPVKHAVEQFTQMAPNLAESQQRRRLKEREIPLYANCFTLGGKKE